MSPGQPWRLRVRSVTGEDVGAGFCVTREQALTCAHVIEPGTECLVELPGSDAAQRCAVKPVQLAGADRATRSDIAVITLARPLTAAPLGPAEPPPPGVVLEAVGFPDIYAGHGDREQITQIRVSGPLADGLLQVEELPGKPPIVEGYSGSAAVDVRSGRAVGMVVESGEPGVAWIIPLRTIACAWTELASLLPRGLDADPDFTRAVRDLDNRAYPDALSRLNTVRRYYPREPDVYYYQVLAALHGRRPGGYDRAAIDDVTKLLDYALQLDRNVSYVAALRALIIEDYFVLRGLRAPGYRREEPGPMDAKHAREILLHVPAFECPTWQYLSKRSV